MNIEAFARQLLGKVSRFVTAESTLDWVEILQSVTDAEVVITREAIVVFDPANFEYEQYTAHRVRRGAPIAFEPDGSASNINAIVRRPSYSNMVEADLLKDLSWKDTIGCVGSISGYYQEPDEIHNTSDGLWMFRPLEDVSPDDTVVNVADFLRGGDETRSGFLRRIMSN
jgi:hypothetical protein